MDNFQVAKQMMMDIQSVATEALDRLDRLPTEDLTIEEACYRLLKKYTGAEPSQGDVLTFKAIVEIALHKDYGVSTSKF